MYITGVYAILPPHNQSGSQSRSRFLFSTQAARQMLTYWQVKIRALPDCPTARGAFLSCRRAENPTERNLYGNKDTRQVCEEKRGN
jgi:hypothetical protein